jgi:hypothetical protein
VVVVAGAGAGTVLSAGKTATAEATTAVVDSLDHTDEKKKPKP